MNWIPIMRRYWFWQRKKMLRDDVGYTVGSTLRPIGIRWIQINKSPGAVTTIPPGWELAPAWIGDRS